MDSTSCYLIILERIETHDYTDARTYAVILHNWLTHRGFYPNGYEPERVDHVLEELLKPACAPNAIRTRFQSITCYECDAGQHLASIRQAVDEGWTEIIGGEDLTVTSHLGTCPICRIRQDQELLM